MNAKQKRELAWEAFQAGVRNGGDSSPHDHDYNDIQRSIKLAFNGWWESYCARKRSP